MELRILGNDLKVSALGLGCMGLTHAYGPATEKKEAVKLIRDAYELGYTFFDTAECYLGTYPDGSPANNEEVAGVMADLMAEGKIIHWGISETTEDYLRRANAVCKVTAIQNRYSMMARWHESLFPVLEELNIGLVAFSPLANGVLTGAYGKGDTFAPGDFRNFMPQYTQEGMDANQKLLALVRDMAREKNATPGQLSLAWMLCKKPYIVPIPGSRRLERVRENGGAAEVQLTAEEVRQLDEALDSVPTSGVFGGHGVKNN